MSSTKKLWTISAFVTAVAVVGPTILILLLGDTKAHNLAETFGGFCSVIAVVLVAGTLVFQTRELSLQRKEYTSTRKALEDQGLAMREQRDIAMSERFDARVFRRMRMLANIEDNYIYTPKDDPTKRYTGKTAFMYEMRQLNTVVEKAIGSGKPAMTALKAAWDKSVAKYGKYQHWFEAIGVLLDLSESATQELDHPDESLRDKYRAAFWSNVSATQRALLFYHVVLLPDHNLSVRLERADLRKSIDASVVVPSVVQAYDRLALRHQGRSSAGHGIPATGIPAGQQGAAADDRPQAGDRG